MKPFATPVSKTRLTEIAHSVVQSYRDSEQISRAVSDNVTRRIAPIINLYPKPEVKSARALTMNYEPAVVQAVGELADIDPDSAERIIDLRNDVCTRVRLELYRDWIAYILQQFQAYFQHARHPRPWGLGEVQYWENADGENWGAPFYTTWRRNIAPHAPDEVFWEVIVPRIPEGWAEQFGTQVNDSCPHDWKSMSDEETAEVLQRLVRDYSPDDRQRHWGIGSIQYWYGPRKQVWGKSYYNALTRTISPSDPRGHFKTHVLPHLPRSWSHRFNGIENGNGHE